MFMNSMMVHIIQLVMIWCVWNYLRFSENFYIAEPNSALMLIARFVASMAMHIRVEKDVRGGL